MAIVLLAFRALKKKSSIRFSRSPVPAEVREMPAVRALFERQAGGDHTESHLSEFVTASGC